MPHHGSPFLSAISMPGAAVYEFYMTQFYELITTSNTLIISVGNILAQIDQQEKTIRREVEYNVDENPVTKLPRKFLV